jgi:hypothetical protein
MDLRKLLVDTCKVFDKLKINYVLIGGYAGILYGSPYTTADIDYVVVSKDVSLKLIDELQKIGWVPTEDYRTEIELRAFGQFVHEPEGYPLHIFPQVDSYRLKKGVLTYELEVEGYPVKICSPEDLVLMRLAVWTDEDKAKAIALVLARKLDQKYLEKRAKEEKLEKRLVWLKNKIKEEN